MPCIKFPPLEGASIMWPSASGLCMQACVLFHLSPLPFSFFRLWGDCMLTLIMFPQSTLLALIILSGLDISKSSFWLGQNFGGMGSMMSRIFNYVQYWVILGHSVDAKLFLGLFRTFQFLVFWTKDYFSFLLYQWVT